MKNIHPDNRVTIRVWYPNAHGLKTKSKVALKKLQLPFVDSEKVFLGHVSLEIAGQSFSLWPRKEPKWISQVVEATNCNYDQDKKSEGKEPHLVVCLYSLDIQKIIELGNELLSPQAEGENNIKAKYVTSGYAEDGNSNQIAYNCTSFIHTLLKAGGLDELNTSKFSQEINDKYTPTGFARLIKGAKRTELARYDETHEFKKAMYGGIGGEYSPERPSKLKASQTMDEACVPARAMPSFSGG